MRIATRVSLFLMLLGLLFSSLSGLPDEFKELRETLAGRSERALTNDFLQYWSAVRLFEVGKDAYDQQVMFEFQWERFKREVPIMMWNPPWTALLFYPLAKLEFLDAAKVWFLLSVGVYLLVCRCLYRHSSRLQSAEAQVYLVASILSFVPLWDSLRLGQLGVLLFAGAAALYFGHLRKSTSLLVLGWLLLSVKFHSYYLLFVYSAWKLIRSRNWTSVATLFVSAIAVLLLTVFVFPYALQHWLSSLASPTGTLVPGIGEWVGVTPLGALRYYFSSGGVSWVLLSVILPVACAAVLLILLMRSKLRLDFTELYVILLLLSQLTSPFGWFFDQTAAVFILFFLARVNLLLGFFALQVFTFLILPELQYHHQLFWYLLCICLLFLISYKARRAKAQNQS